MRIAFDVVGLDVVLTTVLPFVRRGYWWVRIWDFPRVQIAAIEALVLAALLLMGPFGGVQGPIIAALALAVGYQAYRIWPFTPLARSRSCRAYARSPIESCASWSPMCWCRTGRAPS